MRQACTFQMSSGKDVDAPDAQAFTGADNEEQPDAKAFDFGNASNKRTKPKAYETFTERNADAYELDKGERLAVVFNHFKFDKLETRYGTDKDVKEIQRVFGGQLGFTVVVHNDLTSDEIA